MATAGHRGDASEARAALSDPDAGVRIVAIGALERCQQLDSATLTALLADDSVAVRARAATAAASHPEVDLTATLADADATVVEAAAWAAGERRGGDGELERLCSLATEHADALVREAAVAALGALGDEAGLPAILAATRDKATVRRRAMVALAPFEGPGVDAALERGRLDRDRQVRDVATDLSAPPP